jgi:hypothetical protein
MAWTRPWRESDVFDQDNSIGTVDRVDIKEIGSPIWNKHVFSRRFEYGLVGVRNDLRIVCAWSGVCNIVFENK